MDELRNTPADDQDQKHTPPRGGQSVASRRYSEAALDGRQPPVTCLIPKRPWTLWTLCLLGLVGIAGIETLYTHVFTPAPEHLKAALTGLDVTARGSLASWYATLLLALAVAASVAIFALRRHRLDDYHGRYRVWIWAPLALLLASLDAATGLHAVIAGLLNGRTGLPYASGDVWGIVVLWTVLGLVGIRIWWEIRTSRLAVVSVLVAATMYTVTTAVKLGSWLSADSLLAAMAGSASLLLGHLAVLFTMLAYCRFVYLDAQGTLSSPPQRRTGTDARPAAAANTSPPRAPAKIKRKKRSVRLDPSHDEATRHSSAEAKTAAELSSAANADRAASPPEQHPQKQLSKAERRRLRKQMRKQSPSS